MNNITTFTLRIYTLFLLLMVGTFMSASAQSAGIQWLKTTNLITIENLTQVQQVDYNTFVGGDLIQMNQSGNQMNNSNFPNYATRSLEVTGKVHGGNDINIFYSGAFGAANTIVQQNSNQYTVNGRRFNANNSNQGSTLVNDNTLSSKAAQIKSDLESASQALSQLAANNTIGFSNQGTELQFNVNTKDANGTAIFNVTKAQVFENGAVSQIIINNNANATTILINVSGTSVNWQGANKVGNWLNSANGRNRTIWNFYEATSMTMARHFMGALLAPKAAVQASADIHGSAAVKTLNTSSSVLQPLFVGNVAAPLDTDGDGTADATDIDDDNDGIQDTTEGTADTDNDGVLDRLDLDADNDGILDVVEGNDGTLDTNNDGVINKLDTGFSDTDNDGMDDDSELTTPPNTDGDGKKDFQDLDSDNDAINDITEAGISDTNQDGIVNSPTIDTDKDGIPDSVDGTDNGFGSANGAADALNTDGDAKPDYQDLDADNDGINDILESGNTDNNGDGIADNPNSDTDGDGIPNSVDGLPNTFGDAGDAAPIDTDTDGRPNFQDLDSDNDTISDLVENGNANVVDANDDGVVDGPDADKDGIQDSVDGDDNQFGDNGNAAPVNTDGSGPADYADLDSNNDGKNDINEANNGGLDSNNDGTIDNKTDTDKDGIADVVDTKPTFGGLPAPAKKIFLSGKVFLQGPYNTATHSMNLGLNPNGNSGLLPITDPYGLNVTAPVNPNTTNGIVDWVKIEVRAANAPATILKSIAAFVKSDGTLVDINNTATIELIGLAPGNYHIAIRHRNHLGIMTNNVITFPNASVGNVDFTVTNPVHGVYGTTNARVQVESGVWAMWGGDANGDQVVYDSNDPDGDVQWIINNVLGADPGSGFLLNAYSSGDVNMDGVVYDSNDPDGDVQWVINNVLGADPVSGFVLGQLPSSSNGQSANKIMKGIPSTRIQPYTLAIYPNPAYGNQVTMDIESKEERKEVQVIMQDAVGKIMNRQSMTLNKGTNRFTISTADLTTGFYFIRLEGTNQVLAPVKLIKK